ncbi:hypothetical protein Dimus_027763 [Dionaea muscipula]
MPRKLRKSLKKYLSKIKKQAPHLHISPSSLSSATSKILSGCKHPKSLSFSLDRTQREYWTHHHNHRCRRHHPPDDQDSTKAATLAGIDRFLCENFKSLYANGGEDIHEDHHSRPGPGCRQLNKNNHSDDDDDDDDEEEEEKETPCSCRHIAKIPFDSSSILHAMPLPLPLPRDDHRRFCVSSSSSGSLVDEARPSTDGTGFTTTTTPTTTTTTTCNMTMSADELPGEDCIAVLTTSADPYNDFAISMAKMIEARTRRGEAVDWEFIEELLFCYLRLNDKRQYRYILGAFVDLVMSLREEAGDQSSSGRSGTEISWNSK